MYTLSFEKQGFLNLVKVTVCVTLKEYEQRKKYFLDLGYTCIYDEYQEKERIENDY